MQVDQVSPGVLDPTTARTKFDLRKIPPAPALAPFVEYYWQVSWDLAEEFTQRVVPHPNVHLVVEPDGTWVYGVLHGLFRRTLVGRGHVLGVRFHAGGFRPWLGRRVSVLTDERFAAADLVPGLAPDVAPEVDALEAALLPLCPPVDPVVAEVRAMVAAIGDDRGLTRVDDLADRFGRTVRSVQRLFNEYVGVGPKWVIRRYRMHEAAARADEGGAVDWARLAADLGFSDQAHFSREFRSAVGISPARYAAGR
ncbi:MULTISPECIES: helix-turn-helix domain-containing protein [Actinokineospora]|uniref:helix-turn-helix domain-containing protein n=1 Tax=Actinokineospora TaxID=39845 RepID=UPI001E5D56E5|nr:MULTISPECIES: helix-turn-helix domain-containing protein [Actinokineospora]